MFKDFRYQTLHSWSRERRVIGKAEWMEKGANPRFVVTSLPPERMDARAVYEDFYCARGDMENRIKEQQLDMFADRTSAATMRANQLRLYLSSAAYILMHALRRLGLKNTDLAHAQCQTIRLKLLKIGAQVRVTVRNIWISLAGGYPYADTFAAVVAQPSSLTTALLKSSSSRRNSSSRASSDDACPENRTRLFISHCPTKNAKFSPSRALFSKTLSSLASNPSVGRAPA